MKLSELVQQDATELAWGVEIDAEIFDPPAALQTVGLLWEGDGPEAISDALIDTVIAFNLSGADVIVEVRPDDDVDPEYLLTLAGNAGFSVAAVPPVDADGLESWCTQSARFADALLTVPNFSKTLYPATGYLSYLVGELFAGSRAMTPTDPYTLGRFVDATPEDWSNAAKAAMRAALAERLGGEDKLKAYLGAILTSLHAEAERHILHTAQTQPNA